ncbi:hypothetical protein HanRHA438_Chr16g0738131 [Helianthus annuus]|nr:hypothetical protein HanHA300_Chr16g0591491 [Helianthus annuus]KAJ0440682.1 hypothetical protein HanIR_Chr16g0789431 [Helianthus annuus]KAJ0458779.1 hypothetical protein HanHA89_Chr16g0641661 [Helianthus annuus]KAJ0639320.1 hypothetical protein HanLR1_Chr16g0602631 [Helianthus annuus]KAJ0643306.1 hypothetical protein HanOQP8_Chr16g0599141 [Helianthus annuus]
MHRHVCRAPRHFCSDLSIQLFNLCTHTHSLSFCSCCSLSAHNNGEHGEYEVCKFRCRCGSSSPTNTEVYLRNLVAYEACVAAGPLVMARYTELMNGIIDTEEDAKYLRERGIVVNHLKSHKEVADLWNGMSKSVKLTKVVKMDKVVADVNKMYGQTWRVKSAKYLKTYVFASWKILTLLAALFMLFLTTVQAFCSVYSCARVFHQLPEITGSEGAE